MHKIRLCYFLKATQRKSRTEKHTEVLCLGTEELWRCKYNVPHCVRLGPQEQWG